MKKNIPHFSCSGFTLIELLVTIAIMGIAASIAIPGFSRWLPDYRLRSATRDMFTNFQLARQRAVRERVNCTITFNQVVDGVVYDYVVFVDADNDLEYDAGATGDGFDNNYDGNVDESGESEFILTKVLLSDHYGGVSFDIAKGEGDGLTFTNNDDGIPAVAFSPDGLTKTNSGGFGAGTTFFINTNCKETQTVVSSLGGVRVE